MEFSFGIGTAVGIMSVITIVAVYFVWVRKLGKKQD